MSYLNYTPSMELRDKVGTLPFSPGVYLYKDAGGRVIYVGKAKSPPQPRPQLLLRRQARRHQNRHPDRRGPRHRLHPGRQRKRGPRARKQPDQAVQAALQHPAARRQNVPVHQAHRRKVSAGLRDPPPAARTAPLTSARTSRPTWRTAWCTSSTAISRCPPAKWTSRASIPTVPAVPHSPLPGPLRAGPHHRRGLRRSRPRCPPVPGRPPQRPGPRSARAAWTPRPRTCASKKPPACATCITTVEEIEERQKMAAAKGDDVDIFAVYAEPPLVALNLFHLRNGQIVDRREFFWEDQDGVRPAAVFLARCSSRSTWTSSSSRPDPRACGVRRSRSAGGAAHRKAPPQGGDPHAAARPEEGTCWIWWRPTRSTASTRVSAC